MQQNCRRFIIMKKLSIIALALVLILVLCACGGRNKAETVPSVTEIPTTVQTTPIIDPTMETNIPDPEVDTSMPDLIDPSENTTSGSDQSGTNGNRNSGIERGMNNAE